MSAIAIATIASLFIIAPVLITLAALAYGDPFRNGLAIAGLLWLMISGMVLFPGFDALVVGKVSFLFESAVFGLVYAAWAGPAAYLSAMTHPVTRRLFGRVF